MRKRRTQRVVEEGMRELKIPTKSESKGKTEIHLRRERAEHGEALQSRGAQES